MKIVVAICVHNRTENIAHWLHCWSICDTTNAELVIIQNNAPSTAIAELCQGVTYIPVNRPGFDIGRLQDVSMNRLEGFPEYDLLLWACDDCFPMSKDFIQQYVSRYTPGMVVAMQISPYVRTHIRTTGFMIDRATLQQLKFPADPVTTKEHCYKFEHRDPLNHFYSQVKSVQVAPNEISPMWDTGYHRRLPRGTEHAEIFGPAPLPGDIEQQEITTVICPIYNESPTMIIASMLAQTNPNWRLWLIHNGPSDDPPVLPGDARITWEEKPEYTGNWGHATRSEWLQKVKSKYVMITNPDNYYAPPFLEICLREFIKKGKYVGVYSQQMVHNYKQWQVINCSMAKGYIDCGGIVLNTEKAKAVGWNNITDHSADWLFFADLLRKYGAQCFVPVVGCLYTHN